MWAKSEKIQWKKAKYLPLDSIAYRYLIKYKTFHVSDTWHCTEATNCKNITGTDSEQQVWQTLLGFDCSTFTRQCLTVVLKGTTDHLCACISMQLFCSVFTLATLLSSKTESFYLSFLPSLHFSSPKYPNTYPNWIIKSLKFTFGVKMTQRTSMPGMWDLEFLGVSLLQGTLSRFICCGTQEGILTNHVLTRDTICPTEPDTDFKKEDKRTLISFWWVTVCLKW